MDKIFTYDTKDSSAPESNIVEPRRSGWSTFFTWIGCGLLVVGVAFFVFALGAPGRDQGPFLTVAIVGLAGSLQSLFFGFVINVFTDIRWYLQKIANKDS